jgi:hypothetical protein
MTVLPFIALGWLGIGAIAVGFLRTRRTAAFGKLGRVFMPDEAEQQEPMPALAARRASRAGYQPPASTFGFCGVPRTRGDRSPSTWTPPTWKSTGRRSGAGRPPRRGLGRASRNHIIGMMRTSTAVTDSNYVGLTGPDALRSGRWMQCDERRLARLPDQQSTNCTEAR